MQIVLVGFMGCGKSTIGKKLAQQFNLDFFDLDVLIEKQYRKTTTEIIEKESIWNFRRKENAELIKFFNLNDNYILATGGGTPCFFDNNELILSQALSIYMKVDYMELFRRLRYNKRPLLTPYTPDERLGFIHELLELREPYYKKALLTIEANNIIHFNFSKAVEDIKISWKNYSNKKGSPC